MTDKPVCHERRHMTPSLYMTYDTMRAMAESHPQELKPHKIIRGNIVCYARLTTISNHNSLSRNQNRDNIAALERLGWLIAEERPRFRGGRFGTNRYIVLTHEGYECRALRHDNHLYKRCPDFKFESSTGKLLHPSNGLPEQFTMSEYSDAAMSEYSDAAPCPSIRSTVSESSDTSLVLACEKSSLLTNKPER
jgi:hypothetical protein